jgi:hypothetical protein
MTSGLDGRGEGSGRTVLVSNAELHFGVALVQHLKGRGWEALHVPNPHVALSRWDAIRPRWVITGFDDGDVDGFEFLQAVASRAAAAQFPRPRVLVCAHPAVLTGMGPATRRLLGIDLVLGRPCRLDAIEEALGRDPRPDDGETALRLESYAVAADEDSAERDERMVQAS